MTKNNARYIICSDRGPMFWEDEQLVYASPGKAYKSSRVQVFTTHQQARGYITRSNNWRDKMGFSRCLYWIYRLAE